MSLHPTRGFSAVAPFPREQDYGIDFVATLLRRNGGRNLAADRTIAVQTKSVSTRSITYDGAAARWLRELDLPYFIGSVDTANESMALYSTQQFHRAYVESAYETYRLDLDPVPEKIESSRFRSINLDRPILTWKASEIHDREFLNRAYASLKPLVDAEYLNLKTRRFGHIKYWTWETNGIPTHHSNQYSHNPGASEAVAELYRSITEQVNMIGMVYATKKDREAWEILLRFQAVMRRDGFDPNPDGLLLIGQLFEVGTPEEWDTIFPKLKGALRQRDSGEAKDPPERVAGSSL